MSGLYCSAITRSTFDVVGIDLDEAALEQARRSREAARHGSLRKFFLYSGLSGKKMFFGTG